MPQHIGSNAAPDIVVARFSAMAALPQPDHFLETGVRDLCAGLLLRVNPEGRQKFGQSDEFCTGIAKA